MERMEGLEDTYMGTEEIEDSQYTENPLTQNRDILEHTINDFSTAVIDDHQNTLQGNLDLMEPPKTQFEQMQCQEVEQASTMEKVVNKMAQKEVTKWKRRARNKQASIPSYWMNQQMKKKDYLEQDTK